VANDVVTIGNLLIRAADERPEQEAVIFPSERLRTADVLEGALSVARGLRGLGVRRGSHVGILMPNCPDFVRAFLGCNLLGAVTVPVNARYQQRELAYVAENGDLDVLLTVDVIADNVDFAERLHDGLTGLSDAQDPERLELPDAPTLRSVVMLGSSHPAGMVGPDRFREIGDQVGDEVIFDECSLVDPDDTAIMLYTSGTTSHPKGCLLSHAAVVGTWMAVARRFGVSAGDRFWNPCPMFHMSGIGPMLFTLALGSPLVSLTHFSAETAIRQIHEERAKFIFPAFPLITMDIFKHPDCTPEKMSSVEAMLNVAPPDTWRMLQGMLPTAVQGNTYGQTELSGITCWTEPSDTLDERAETNGRPLEGVEVRIVDPDSQTLIPDGEPGEIQARGFQAFKGYYRDPELTAATLLAGGWVRTGDIGVADPSGRISYVGRLKDMLKVGGENVAATEIEARLSLHPAVKLVQVVGKPDDRYQEVPVAFVELAEGHTTTEAELIDHVRGQLASFKVPREIHFVTEWPMSATKIQKFRLLEQLETGVRVSEG
jgi:fatty-acyl-CoA synthase